MNTQQNTQEHVSIISKKTVRPCEGRDSLQVKITKCELRPLNLLLTEPVTTFQVEFERYLHDEQIHCSNTKA